MNTQPAAQKVKITVIMVDGSFRPHFALIDLLKSQTLAAEDYEVLWIEYYDEIKQELIDKMHGQRNFRAITLKKSGTYHSSYCFNRGITEARGEVLVIPDADVLVEADFLETAWGEHRAHDQLAMYVFRMDEPKRESSLCLDLNYLKRVCVLTNPQNYGGCLTIRKKWLMKVNGYEQHDMFGGGAHANGRDVYTRLKNMGMYVKWHPQLRLYHPWHPHPQRFQDGYVLQNVLIDHRAACLDMLPYNGIDPAFDRDLPQSLQVKLDAERSRILSRRP